MKALLIFFLTLIAGLFFLMLGQTLYADSQPVDCGDNLDCVNKQISDLTNALNQSVAATKPLQSQVTAMQAQVEQIKQNVAIIEQDLALKKQQIDKGFADLTSKERILNATVRDLYIKSYSNSPLLTLLSSNTASNMTQQLAYQKATQDQDKSIITNLVLAITDLQQQRQELNTQETQLIATKANLDVQTAKLNQVIAGAQAYQASLNSQIASLTAKQQQLLAAKLASLDIPLYAYNTQGGCSSDINPYKDPGFGGTKFAFFTYGVPNRVGLNQYGALGRAQAGQNSDTILHAYYNFDGYQNSNITIKVNDGNGFNTGNIIWTGSLDDYVKRIYEVPDSWPIEALKAQAIAARSYAVAATDNGAMSICANQNCQVFQTNDKGGNWDTAVNDTAGQVMVQGGQVVKAWFSSTHGGYVHSSAFIGWSATSFTKDAQDASGPINNWSDLQNNAYDKNSPWFYCDWGGRSQYNNTAWLQPSEVADIVNVILLAKADSSTQPHLSQTDKPNPDGTDTWDASQVQQELQNRGIKPFTTISSISVSADFGSGVTTSITFNGDGGQQTFSGSDFKNYFNLRAPSNINIVGPLFNVEEHS